MSDEGNEVSVERRNRIRLALAAYAYEMLSETIMSDAEFDQLALAIRPEISTIEDHHDKATRRRYAKLDKFFKTEFSPHTGQWVHKHPEIKRLRTTYQQHWGKKD